MLEKETIQIIWRFETPGQRVFSYDSCWRQVLDGKNELENAGFFGESQNGFCTCGSSVTRFWFEKKTLNFRALNIFFLEWDEECTEMGQEMFKILDTNQDEILNQNDVEKFVENAEKISVQIDNKVKGKKQL